VTADGSWAAHFEHTVAITDDGPFVLTAEDGGASGFAALHSGSCRAMLAWLPRPEAAAMQPHAAGVVGGCDGI
jgi:hypothetical protein